MTFLLPDGAVSRLSEFRPLGRALPAPLHLALSFARLAHFTAGEKRRLAAGVTALARGRGGEDEDFQTWLGANGQTDRLVARFWHPVLVSALSEVPGRMSVAGARKVIADGFLAHPAAWRVFVPTVPLDVLYGERLLGWLTANGVTVETGAGVRSTRPRFARRPISPARPCGTGPNAPRTTSSSPSRRIARRGWFPPISPTPRASPRRRRWRRRRSAACMCGSTARSPRCRTRCCRSGRASGCSIARGCTHGSPRREPRGATSANGTTLGLRLGLPTATTSKSSSAPATP